MGEARPIVLSGWVYAELLEELGRLGTTTEILASPGLRRDLVESVVAADGVDLADVMQAVHEVKAAPLLHGQRSEDEMGDSAAVAEEALSMGGGLIELEDFHVEPGEEVVASPDGDGLRWRDGGGGETPMRKAAEREDAELSEPLAQRGLGPGDGSSFDAGDDGGEAAAIGLEEMFSDLLDAPLVELGGGDGLSLAGREPEQGAGEAGVKLTQIWVHG